MTKLQILPPSNYDPIELADWLETTILVRRYRKVSRSLVRRLLRDPQIGFDDNSEITIELTLQEMLRRYKLAGKAYPFVPAETGMCLAEDNGTAYKFLLCLSTSER